MSTENSLEVTRILAYDLPSESSKSLEEEQKQKIRAVRVKCVKLLHKLGIQSTESVILIAPSKLEKVEPTIAKVNELYQNLGYGLNPSIVLIGITNRQLEQFNTLAKKRLIEKIDEGINRISILLTNLENITNSRSIRRRLENTRREYVTLKQLANQLGIDVNNNVEYLIRLIDEALSKIS